MKCPACGSEDLKPRGNGARVRWICECGCQPIGPHPEIQKPIVELEKAAEEPKTTPFRSILGSKRKAAKKKKTTKKKTGD